MIRLQVDQAIVGRVLVDGGSSADVLLWDAFQKMGLDKKVLVLAESPLVAFDGIRAYPRRVARLMVHTTERTLPVNFLVMESKMPSWVEVGYMQCMV